MNGYTAKTWMTIAGGGRWTIAEVKKELPEIQRKRIENAVAAMLVSGMLKRYEGEHPSYGVTSDCAIPRGVTVSQLLALMRPQ